MLKNGKIQFFSIWAGATSSRAMKVIDTQKNCIFFSIFRIFQFWSILTTFDQVSSRKRTGRIWHFVPISKQIFRISPRKPAGKLVLEIDTSRGYRLVYYAHFEYHESPQLLRSSENERVQKIAKSHKILFFLQFLKKSKIHFFSIWAGESSSRAAQVIDTPKNCIFSQFSEFLKFSRFWLLLTQFWVSNVLGKTSISERRDIEVSRFVLKTSQKVLNKIWKNI